MAEININGVGYKDLEILSDAEVPSLIRKLGKPNHKDFDGVLGDSFKNRFIGYIPEKGGALIKPSLINRLLLSDKPSTRKVFFCEYKNNYWFSLDYGYSQHLEFPRNLKGDNNE